MKTTISIIYTAVLVWAVIRLWRSSFSLKAKIIWSFVVTFLPLGAFLSLANRPGEKQVFRYTTSAYALLIGSFLCLYGLGFRWYKVPTGAMEPTLIRGNHVIGRLDTSYAAKIRRFDIVIYRRAQESGAVFISRLVGLPGDHVEIRANVLSVNGEKIRTLSQHSYPGPKEHDIQLTTDTFFVLGDNEENSLDSRILGPMRVSDSAGYLVFRK